MTIKISDVSFNAILLLFITAVVLAAICWDLGNTKAMDAATQADKLRVYCQDRPADAVCVVIKKMR